MGLPLDLYPGHPILQKSWVQAAIMAGGAIAGGVMQNNAQQQMQSDANSQSERQAQLNREWQQYMSNTAHQREVQDLKAAGLNPILSATRGTGASTPSGSVANIGAAKMEDVIGKGVSSAKDAYLLDLQRKTAEADIALKTASTTAAAASAAKDVSSAKNIDRSTINAEAETDRLANESHAWKSRYQAENEANQLARKQTAFDKKALVYDNIMNRAEQATGMVSNLIPAIKLRVDRGNEKIRTENKTMKDYINRRQKQGR